MSKKMKLTDHPQLPRQPKALLRQCLPGALVRIVDINADGEPHFSIALLVKWVQPYTKGAGRRALVMQRAPSADHPQPHVLEKIDRDQIVEWTNPIPIDTLIDYETREHLACSSHTPIVWISEQPTF